MTTFDVLQWKVHYLSSILNTTWPLSSENWHQNYGSMKSTIKDLILFTTEVDLIDQATWSHSIAAGHRSNGLANIKSGLTHCNCFFYITAGHNYVHAGDPQIETIRFFHIHHLDLPEGKIDVRCRLFNGIETFKHMKPVFPKKNIKIYFFLLHHESHNKEWIYLRCEWSILHLTDTS